MKKIKKLTILEKMQKEDRTFPEVSSLGQMQNKIIELEYRISNKTSLDFTPMIKYHRTDFVNDLLTYGFSVSFKYRFDKKEEK